MFRLRPVGGIGRRARPGEFISPKNGSLDGSSGKSAECTLCASAQVERDTGIPADNVVNIIDGIPAVENFRAPAEQRGG